MKIQAPQSSPARAEWTNRVLIISLLGIAALTLFPFRLNSSPRPETQPTFLLLRLAPKGTTLIDFILNILLFVPFGFGVALWIRKKGTGLRAILLSALVAGAIVSFAIEFLQLFIPTRDSSWDDVLSNTIGSVAGAILCAHRGDFFVDLAAKWEFALEDWISPARAALILAIYFAIALGVSVAAQRESRLSNWDPQCSLTVGSDPSERSRWNGRIYRLEIWNRALPENRVAAHLEGDATNGEGKSLLTSYNFSGVPPFEDQQNFLPPLAPIAGNPVSIRASATSWGGVPRLSTGIPVGNLTRAIQKTNQFTIRVVCEPSDLSKTGGRIVSLVQSDGMENFYLLQYGKKLVFWIRTPLSEKRGLRTLLWIVDGAFTAGEKRDIVASYDGANAFLYLDGKAVRQEYRLSPGASLIRRAFDIEVEDLEGYFVMYEAMIFFPAGIFAGIAARGWSRKGIFEKWMIAIFLLLPGALLEFLLVLASGRRVWEGNILLAIIFSVAGALVINSDRQRKTASSAS